MARLFFIEQNQVIQNQLKFSPNDSRHLISLRAKTGDIVDLIIDGDEKQKAKAKILLKDKEFFGIIIERESLRVEYKKKIHILQCIPKLDKMDLIIQKLAELNAYEIIPLFSRYTDIKDHIGENKLTRWKNIAREASIQSGRMDIINIHSPIKLKDFLRSFNSSDNKEILSIILYEKEHLNHLISIEDKIKDKEIKDIYIMIGAEGGFDEEEIKISKQNGFIPITLGNTILRTETAPIAITSIVQYIAGEF